MKPAPPVTIARGVIQGNLYGRRRGGRGEHGFDRGDGLVDPLEHPHAAAVAGEVATDRGPAQHDRELWVAGAQVAQRELHGLPAARLGRADDHEVRGLAVDQAQKLWVVRSVSKIVWNPAAASWS